jgi:hypothetical protein
VSVNPVVSFALAYQMLPRASELAPDQLDALQKAVAALQGQSAAAQVQANLGPASAPDPESGGPAARDYWYTGKIRGAAAAGRFDEARDLLVRLSNSGLRAQVKALVDFSESAADIGRKDFDGAMTMANLLRPGVKRSLLYAGIVIAAKPELGLQVLQMATRDAALLPAEQRARVDCALAAGLVRVDEESAFTMMGEIVKAYNDIYTSPRRGRFDPKSARRIYSGGADTYTDTSLILPVRDGFYEAVDTGLGRQNFRLRVPGVDAFTIPAFLASAAQTDPARLDAILSSLRDENTEVNSWIDLAAARIKAARQ